MWDVLAIAPTDDPKLIRRAYAARLRQIDPDRDRDAFARLRAALEWALAGAGQRRPVPPRGDPPPAEEASPADIPQAFRPPLDVRVFPATPALPMQAAPPAPQPSDDRARERALLIGLESALQRGDAQEASRLYVRAAATGALPLGDAERILARLFAVALADSNFDGAAFRDLARTFGWERPTLDGAAVSEVRLRVAACLDAEDWYDALVVLAERKRKGIKRHQSRVARLVLRRIRGWGLLRISRPALRATLDAFKPHQGWLRDRIDPAWVTTLERRYRRREIIAHALPALFLAAILLNVMVVFARAILGWSHEESWMPFFVIVPAWALLLWLLKVIVRNLINLWRNRP